jgi:hypothetical protein
VVQGQPQQTSETLSEKIPKAKKTGSIAQMVKMFAKQSQGPEFKPK